MKKIFLIFFMMLTLGFLSSPVWAQTYFQEEVKVLMEVKGYADGSHKVATYVVEPETGMYVPFAEYAGTADIAAPPVTLQPIVVTFSWHWKRPATITFKVTNRSSQKIARIRTLLSKYMNQRRGTNMVPRMTINNQKTAIKPITQFANQWDFYNQLYYDGENSVVMTTDDQFFMTPPALGPGHPQPFEPDQTSLTVIMATLKIRQEGGRNVTTVWITESDVYFVNNFWDLPLNARNFLGTAAFRMALGYSSTIWSHDYLSRKNPHVTAAKFNNPTGSPWVRISRGRDNFYYLDALGIGSIQFLETPKLLPNANEVLDIGGYALPTKNQQGNDLELGKTPILFLTNLKAYGGGKKMRVKIWRQTTDTPPQDIHVTTLAGSTIRRPMDFSTGKNVYADIFLNHVRIGQKVKLNRLKTIVRNFGVPKRVDGIRFEKAVRIKVRIEGRLTENGPIKNIERFYWLVDSEPENLP
ncbi:hypothetical protein ACFLT2_08620 [Acidobacteriota bacterium]